MARVELFVVALSACWAVQDAQGGQVHEAGDILGHQLFSLLSRSEVPNVLYSPYSLSSLMGMVYAGAKGDTQEELYRTLGYNAALIAKDKVLDEHKAQTERIIAETSNTVSSANAAALQRDVQVLPAYRNTLKESFDAELFTVDFQNGGEAAVATINDWVGKQTEGLIPKLFEQPLSPATVMVVLNAVYFKGLWATEFNKSATQQLPFYNDGHEATQVATMTGSFWASYGNFEALGFDVLDLPYKVSDYSMTIVLPRGRDGITSLRRTSRRTLKGAMSSLEPGNVNVRLPKFKLQAEYHLKEPFTKLGIRRVFDPKAADLSGVAGQKGLSLSDVIHKAVIEVDETGTEAAAASGAGMVGGTLGDERRIEFYADHPFIFFIRSISNGVLFMGEVNRL